MIAFAKRIANVEEYYFSKKLAEVRKLDASSKVPVINLGIGSPDLSPPVAAIEALISTTRKNGVHGYQNYKGIPAFRQAIADFNAKTYGSLLDPETMILPLMGSKEGIMHIMMAFVDEGDEVLIPDPGYPTYASVAKLVGAKVRTYRMTEESNWKIDVKQLKSQDRSRVKIMWVNFPHMPTGVTASKDELKDLVDLAREKNFLIVNDNPYSLILNDEPLSILAAPNAFEVALELNSLSKSHSMAGWRIGWVAGRADYIDAVLRVKSNMDSGMYLGIQYAAIAALNSPEISLVNSEYGRRKHVAHDLLDLLGCTYSTDQSGLFVWAKAPAHITSVETWIDEILYGAKVFITPGFIFGEAGGRYIRISLCASEEKLEEAIDRIEAWLEKTKR